MTTRSSIGCSALRFGLLASACVLLASAVLLACDTQSTPSRADDVSEDNVAVVDAGAGGDGATADVDSGPSTVVIPWDEVVPTLAEVSGRNVEVIEGGAGSATVVFESGLGSDWTAWDEVAAAVAGRARVFAYSRPGYGASDATTEPRNAARIVEELRALLAARGFAPPYVLVGHSFGGAYMELFAKAHPQDVVALVLVEPRHRDFTAACEAAALAGCTIPDSVVASLPEVERAEIEAFASASAEIRASGGAFGRHPVRVLTATAHGFDPKVETLWESMHGSLADEAAEGEQILFAGAGHMLQLEQPDAVSEVILALIPASGR
jgi:pimeloyl-ACP methyl ester carboxylesterase